MLQGTQVSQLCEYRPKLIIEPRIVMFVHIEQRHLQIPVRSFDGHPTWAHHIDQEVVGGQQ